MLPSRLPALTLLLAVATARCLQADGYDRYYRPMLKVDSAHSTVAFAVPFMGLSRTDGRFTNFTGTVWFDPDDPASAAVTVVIDAKSIDTANATRDEDLRGTQFFDVERFPRITFRSTRVEHRGDSWLATGPLTLHGVTKEVTLPMRRIGDKLPDPWGNLRAGFEGMLALHRADFGMAGNGRFTDLASFAIGSDVDVTLRVQAVQWNVAKWTVDPKSVLTPVAAMLDAKGIDAAVAEYHRLKRDEADKYIFPEGALNVLGHRLMQAHRLPEGLAIFQLNADAFPQSSNTWDDLATAKAVNGDLEGAAAAAHHALELDDANTDALELLRQLEPAGAKKK
jgi:polyisoprenoid-binding protein YceI